MKPVELKIYGIKCDNKNCDYRDMSVKYEEYDKWLNKPCPKCGENLLTSNDLKGLKRIVKIAKVINHILPTPKDDKKVVKAELIWMVVEKWI